MVVCLNTGMHRKFDDSKEYYHYSCGTGVEAGKWFVKHKVKCVAMDSQALDHPLHTAMGKNGMPQMNLLGASGRPITEEYIEQFGEEAYAEFEKAAYIKLHGQEAYDEKFGDLEAIGSGGTWEPCHKQMLGHGIVGVENLGGDLDKVVRQALPVLLLPDPLVHGRRLHGPLRGRNRRRRHERRSGTDLHLLRHRLRPGRRSVVK